ncbi:uncharacterized protein ChaoS9_220 [Halobacterium phage ChaoS9]|uniref:Uncharacterized protein n=1 Tax=Halobacterium phage ChaoS9 TaxID=2847105 RepID=A0A481V8F9_9CAUD|nr:uncharacterized protein KMC41_gp45 [Halobacterium phage ChaoS9]QBI90049.1 uncharacterized protein ChaoS9_220 [Halobacterium phage ChaoS9]
MKTDGRSPFTHGMEVEQFPGPLHSDVRSYTMNNDRGSLDGWHRDASGPRETSIGAYKNCKTILNRFYADTRDEGITWDWHAAHDGAGAGSHVHLCVAGDVFEDEITAWTISYNTVVELFPFLAPYFCHDWENGFREGTTYRGSELNVEHWAEGQTTRLSQDSVRDRVANPRSYRREYSSVTFNPAQTSGKPLTIELRANDAHPAMALNGLLTLRRLTGCAIEAGWSPKLENHRQTLQYCYDRIYHRATDVGLITAMKQQIPGGITFQEGRGIPGVEQREFDTMWEVLRAIQIAYPQTPNTWRCRAYNLVRAGRDEFSPANNVDALWNIDAEQGEFRWDHGPRDHTSAAQPAEEAEEA